MSMSVQLEPRHRLARAKLKTLGYCLILTALLSGVFWLVNMALFVALAFHYTELEAAETAQRQVLWLLGGALACSMGSLWVIRALWRHMRWRVIESDKLPKDAHPRLRALPRTILVVAMCLVGAYVIALVLPYVSQYLFADVVSIH